MGKERISSQEIADYTNINATQIRRDLSNFGKFGKRGVGYSIDSLLAEIRKILRTQGQHNIALVGAGRLGQAIASSPIFAEHGINIAAVFDASPTVIGSDVGGIIVEDERRLKDAVRDKNIVVGVLAVPADRRAEGRGRSRRRGRADHLQLLGSAPRRPGRRDRAHLEPRGRAAARAVLPPDLASDTRCDTFGVRILLWHGYLLGGTGSNVYTRALAREWSNAGHDVVVVCQERAPEQYDLGGAQVVERRAARQAAARLRAWTATPGSSRSSCRTSPTPRSAAYVEANAATLRELLPADLVFANHVLMGGPVGAASGAPFRVKAHGSELEYSMRGRPELERWGAEALAAAEATYVGSAHIREVLEDVVGHVERVHEVPPGVDVRRVHAPPARRGARGADRRGARRPAEPGQRERAPARRRQRRAPRGVPRRRRADRRLLREADRAEGRAGAARGDAAASTRASSSSASARTARRSRRWRRSGRSSPGRSSTVTSCSCCRSPT